MNNNLPHCKRPCKHCPFRKDTLEGWLSNRIEDDLKSDTFVCHKKPTLQCAGHMLLLDDENQFVRLANHLKIKLNLTGRELIFDTVEDCIKHHKK